MPQYVAGHWWRLARTTLSLVTYHVTYITAFLEKQDTSSARLQMCSFPLGIFQTNWTVPQTSSRTVNPITYTSATGLVQTASLGTPRAKWSAWLGSRHYSIHRYWHVALSDDDAIGYLLRLDILITRAVRQDNAVFTHSLHVLLRSQSEVIGPACHDQGGLEMCLKSLWIITSFPILA